MTITNQKITAPVSIHEVNTVLAAGTTDLGQLCTSTRINPFAKYKPTYFNSLTGGNTMVNGYKQWQGQDGNYGLTPKKIPTTNFGTLIKNAYEYTGGRRMNGWEYKRPDGGTGTNGHPYRLLDFDGYNHAAPPPISEVTLTCTYGSADGNGGTFNAPRGAQIQFIYHNTLAGANPDALNMSDFSCLWNTQNGQPGVVMGAYMENGTHTRRFAGQQDGLDALVSSTQGLITFPTDNLEYGEWTVWPFLSTTTFAPNEGDGGGDFYTIPFAQPLKFNLIYQSLSITITPTINNAGTVVTVGYTIYNQTGQTSTYSRNTCWVTHPTTMIDSGYEEQPLNSTYEKKLENLPASITVQANQQVSGSFQITGVNPALRTWEKVPGLTGVKVTVCIMDTTGEDRNFVSAVI